MKTFLLLAAFQILCAAGFSQSLPPGVGSKAIHFHRPDLVVHWKASRHPWPKTLWTYHVAPKRFSSTVISNLMALGPFTEQNETENGTNGMSFSDSGRYLGISFLLGDIDFRIPSHYDPFNLTKDVPKTNQLFQLTTNLLSKVGILGSELTKEKNGRPKIWFDPEDIGTLYFVNHMTITNVDSREVRFRRRLDGVDYALWADGGSGRIEFGERGRVDRIAISWRGVEHDKLYSAATPKQIMQWIREGRAVQRIMVFPHRGGIDIDWLTVKSLTIQEATAYYDDGSQEGGGNKIRPFAELLGFVDTGKTNLPVSFFCPVIDETKPLIGK